VPDYSEFPTTPTAWQEAQWEEARWQAVTALETEGPPPSRRRGVDLTALVPGVLFCLLAILLMTGAGLTLSLFGGGLAWVLLIGAGVLLLVGELRKMRHRR
jgi:hypothetical protein